MSNQEIKIRRAVKDDKFNIQSLYYRIYSSDYPVTLITNISEMEQALGREDFFWYVAEVDSKIVGSVIYEVDFEQRLGKVFGAVVHPDFQGHNLATSLMQFGMEFLLKQDKKCDIIYATTRTVSPAPQKLTQNLGYIKLGVFPNVRKVKKYETHCLTAYFDKDCLKLRRKPVTILQPNQKLYNLVKDELGLEEPIVDKGYNYEVDDREVLSLEVISAPRFIKKHYEEAKKTRGDFIYYPFPKPNLMFVEPDYGIEVYMGYEPLDHYCGILGLIFDEKTDLSLILRSVVKAAVSVVGIRYLELLAAAYFPNTFKEILKARFVPCAYFPCLRMVKEGDIYHRSGFEVGQRIDFFMFSRTFEILDFKCLKFEGIYKEFLMAYFENWFKLYVDKAISVIQFD